MDDPVRDFKLPVKTHLGVESNLIGSADEPEPLAALVQRRPVVRACVRIVGTCSICLAELALRNVFAAFVILFDGSHVAIRTDVVLVDPEDRAAPLRAHTGVCQPACLGDVSKGVTHFVTSGARVRGKKPSWSSSDGFVVVVVPQVDALASPCVGEHADLKVRLAKGVCSHQGDHLPPRHGKGVAEELDCGTAVSNWVWVNLCLRRLIPKLRVSLNTVSASCLELERTRHRD